MSLSNGVLTNVSDIYVFDITSAGYYYAMQNEYTGYYLCSYGDHLWPINHYDSSYCNWDLSASGSSIYAVNNASSTYPYLSFYDNYFCLAWGTYITDDLHFWKLTSSGGNTYYTTVC